MNRTLLNHLDNICTALMHLANNLGINAHLLNSLGTTRGSYQFKAQLRESLGQLLHLFLVLVGHSKEDTAIERNVHTCTSNSLVKGTSIMIINTHYLASGLHLRPKGNIYISHLVKGEYWCLYSHIRLWWYQAGMEAQLLQRCTKSNLSCHIHHLYISNLAQEWYSSGGTRIYLDNINLIIYHNVLNVHQTLNMKAYSQTLGIVDNGINNLGGQGLWWIYSNRVTRMYAGSLYMLHNTRNNHVNAIGNSIYLYLSTLHIAVYQNRMIRGYLYSSTHVISQLVLIVNDFHSTAAQYIGRTHHNRITNICCAGDSLLLAGNRNSFWTRNMSLSQYLIKALSILCPVNIIYRSTKYLDTSLGKSSRQINGSLATKLNDNTLWLFLVDNVQYVLGSQRLKVQSIRNIKICGYGFWVVVDNNSLNTHIPQCPYRMNRAIVKLYTLTDTDRTRTQNHYLTALAGGIHLIFLSMEGGVIIWRSRLKLSSTCIYHFVAWQNIHGLAKGTDFIWSLASHLSDGTICQTSILGLQHQSWSNNPFLQLILHIGNMLNLPQEPLVNLGDIVNLIHSADTTAESLSYYEDTLIIATGQMLDNLIVIPAIHLVHMKTMYADFQRTNSLQNSSLEVSVNRHNLTGSLHLSAQGLVGINEFIKWPSWELNYAVVQSRLEASLGFLSNSIGNLVQTIANSNLSRNLGNRITGSLGSQSRGTAYTRIYLNNIILVAIRI